MITELKDKQIFCFGSNLNGEHLGGAAKQAYEQFGAEWGIGEGLTGKCYAFPTLDKEMKQVSLEYLIKSRDKLYQCANENKDLEFLLTSVGTGIAGFDITLIKLLFENTPSNITKLF
jgi:hypothetical protein